LKNFRFQRFSFSYFFLLYSDFNFNFILLLKWKIYQMSWHANVMWYDHNSIVWRHFPYLSLSLFLFFFFLSFSLHFPCVFFLPYLVWMNLAKLQAKINRTALQIIYLKGKVKKADLFFKNTKHRKLNPFVTFRFGLRTLSWPWDDPMK